jgi:serine/threonine protein kinase/Flp pilus assembly protein TadD
MNASCPQADTVTVDHAAIVPDHDDSRVVAALERYLRELEAGRRPDRAKFLSAHGELAEVLEPCLDGVDFLARLAPGPEPIAWSAPGIPVQGVLEPEPLLGDFRILREVGRGGMGIVYEAEQISLGRRVALKVLPLAASLDPRQLLRFHTEAQAAAHLHHPHIVPVHAVGNARGIPYYAMQFIEGDSLAQIIVRLRADAERASAIESDRLDGSATRRRERELCRFVARVGVQTARALEHAHALGVLHRDVKPANLLADETGHVWVTDFGLARVQGDAGVTLTGDLVGTIRYMSPEQVLGHRGIVDHRADVYSLGATLYELATLRPVFGGGDRHELLRRVEAEEPVAPRRIDPALPRDLETIILKALAKEPERRYASAHELADDLERFLRDEPIRARRPSTLERAARWGRRHRTAVATVSLGLALGTVVLAVSTIRIWEEKRKAVLAYHNEEAQRYRAQANVELAMQALEHLSLRVAERRSRHDPVFEREDREVLKLALEFYEEFSRQNDAQPRLRWLTALAQGRVAEIHAGLNQPRAAVDAYARAIVLAQRLADQYPRASKFRYLLASCLDRRGILLHAQGRTNDAEAALRASLAIHDAFLLSRTADAEDHRLISMRLTHLAAVLESEGKLDEAQTTYERALALRQEIARVYPRDLELRQELAYSQANLGGLLLVRGQPRPAIALFQQASAIQEALIEQFRDYPAYPRDLARTRYNLGLAYHATQDETRARRETMLAIDIQTRLRKEQRDDYALCEELARSYHSLGVILAQAGEPEKSKKILRLAAELREHACARCGDTPEGRERLANTYHALGRVLGGSIPSDIGEAPLRHLPELESNDSALSNRTAWFLVQRPEPSAEDVREALDLARKAVKLAPRRREFWNTLGVAYYRAGEWQQAQTALEESMRLLGGGDAHDWFYMAMVRFRRGNQAQARVWYDKALRTMGRNVDLATELRRIRDEAAGTLRIPLVALDRIAVGTPPVPTLRPGVPPSA